MSRRPRFAVKRLEKNTMAKKISLPSRGLRRDGFCGRGVWIVASLCLWGSAPHSVAGSDALLQFDGFVEPLEDVQVAALEIGNLQHVLVQVGDRVEAGDVIAVLDPSLQESAVAIAQIHTTMRGQSDAAKAERDLHLLRTEQLRRLQAEGLVRPDEIARAEADLRIAQARLLTVEEELSLREAEQQRYELQLDRRKVRAPISGIVARIFRKAGEFVSPSDPSIVRLINTDHLIAVVNIPAEYVAPLKAGTAVRVHLAMLRRTIPATIVSVAPLIEGGSGTVEVRILLPNPDGQLRAGDRCTVTLSGPAMRSARRSEAGSDR